MAITYDQLMAFPVPDMEQSVNEHDCLLYALGIGMGADPMNDGELRYAYEKSLQMAPMQANVLAYPGFWLQSPQTGVDWRQVLHAEQRFTVHRPLPTEARLRGVSRVTGMRDRGKDRGVFIYVERNIFDMDTQALLCTVEQTNLLRGDGGCGGSDAPPHAPHALPEREPDFICDLFMPANAALLYRLNGDLNPLHADPQVARSAGFERPILHGLCTFGFAGHALLRTVCDYDGARVRSMAVRFTAPAYPGETLRTEIYRDGDVVSFRSRVVERDVIVLGNGRMELAGAQ